MNCGLHYHHASLLTWDRKREERIAQIKEIKPEREWETRLRCIQEVTQEMLAEVPPEIIEAWKAYVEAWGAHVEAWRAYDEAREAFYEARKAYDEARKAYDEALRTHHAALESWHRKWCREFNSERGCPWNGEELVMPKEARE